MGRLVVLLLLAYMTLPTVVVIVASFNATAILAFPPDGLSLRWYENALTYPQFRRAAVNSLIVTAASAGLALPIGTAAALALVRHPVRLPGLWGTMLLSPLARTSSRAATIRQTSARRLARNFLCATTSAWGRSR